MVETQGMFDSVFGMMHTATSAVRGMIASAVPAYADLILLGLSVLGGYYLAKKYPALVQKWPMFVYAIIIFLLLRFV